MPNFEYQALDHTGNRLSGILAAASRQAVLAELESRRLTPVSVTEEKQRKRTARGVSKAKLAASYRQLADLLHAGVPLLRSLQLLGRQKSSPRLAQAYREIGDHVSDGGELSEAMTEQGHIFPSVHVAMVRAGEKGGFLEQVLAELAGFVEAEAELRGKIVGSLVYPAFLVTIGSLILGAVFGIFVPMFEPMFAEIPRLPKVTVLVLAISAAVRTYGLITAGVVLIAVIAAWRAAKKPRVRYWIAVVQTRTPAVGGLIRALAAARFCRLLGTMEANGVPLLTAMRIARDAAGNVLMEQAIDRAVESVRGGGTLADPLREGGLFEEDVVEMVSVGEAAGNIDTVLLNVATTLEKRVDRLLSRAVSLIEPCLLLLIGATIGLVAAGLILPMMQLSAGL